MSLSIDQGTVEDSTVPFPLKTDVRLHQTTVTSMFVITNKSSLNWYLPIKMLKNASENVGHILFDGIRSLVVFNFRTNSI